MKTKDGFEQWFAWYPIKLDGQIIWLQWILKRKTWGTYGGQDGCFTEYKLKEKKP